MNDKGQFYRLDRLEIIIFQQDNRPQERLRPTQIYEEKHVKTELLHNGPLFYMRRLLNDMTTVTQ